MDEIRMIFNRTLTVQRYVIDVEHNRKNFTRLAAEAIAKMIVEEGLLLTESEYDIQRDMYLTHCTLLKLGDEQRKLP